MKTMDQNPVLLWISSNNWSWAMDKGNASAYHDQFEGGFFGEVICVHPLARKTQTINIGRNHNIVEFGFDALPGGARWRPLRILYAPLFVIISVLGIRKLIKQHKVDIVRASDPYWAAMIGYLASLKARVKFCISIHADWDLRHQLDSRNGAPKLFKSRKMAKWMEWFLLRSAGRILCIRKTLFQYAVNSGARTENIRLIRHGVDLRQFKSAPQLLIDLPNKKRVVFAGRLSMENYIDDVITVGKALAKRDDVALLLAGSGPEEELLKAEVKADAALRKTIIFLGSLPREQVIALRIAADVNLVPMGGFSLIEACASGKATVAYDVEWHSELITNGESGLLVLEKDVDALISSVQLLLDEPELASQLGVQGRAAAYKLHDYESVFPQRAAVYRELLDGKL